jgi:hypothetical protein
VIHPRHRALSRDAQAFLLLLQSAAATPVPLTKKVSKLKSARPKKTERQRSRYAGMV